MASVNGFSLSLSLSHSLSPSLALFHPSPSHSLRRPTLSSSFRRPFLHSCIPSFPPTLPLSLSLSLSPLLFLFFCYSPHCLPALHSSFLFSHTLWLSFQTDFIPKQLQTYIHILFPSFSASLKRRSSVCELQVAQRIWTSRSCNLSHLSQILRVQFVGRRSMLIKRKLWNIWESCFCFLFFKKKVKLCFFLSSC